MGTPNLIPISDEESEWIYDRLSPDVMYVTRGTESFLDADTYPWIAQAVTLRRRSVQGALIRLSFDIRLAPGVDPAEFAERIFDELCADNTGLFEDTDSVDGYDLTILTPEGAP